jgi:two-component system, sensor histidine kinase and response regulator
VVDDNDTNLRILVEMLFAWGMKPESAGGGVAALAALNLACQEGRPFRLVITDMQMPQMDGFGLSEEIRRRPSFSAVPIVMLSSSGSSDEAPRRRQLAISNYLIKPVQPSDLLDAILAALSKPVASELETPVKDALPVPGTHRMRILLAEDNAINRKLAIALLEKRGHTVIPTENGEEALAALERENVDLVLMDVQMPIMDGFEAIRSIRAKERRTGAHIPIIAITAHAMKGDREKCLAEGADDYVSKPIRTPELLAAIDRSRTLRVDAPPEPAPSPPAVEDSAPRVFDMDDVLERLEGDRELLEEIVLLFTGECSGNMHAIRQALASGDAHLLERLAHTLKGASANLSAAAVSQAASRLEQLARAGNLASAGQSIENLQRETDRLLLEFASVSHKVTP